MSAPKRRPSSEDGPNAGGPHGDAAAVWLPLDALVPHPKNPRVHGPEVTRLARTILRTAWGAPIVAQWRASGRHRVIAGHGRLLAAREILAGVEVDGEMRGGADHLFDPAAPGPGLLPVRVVRVSDAEADAMTLADNARGIQGEDSAELIVEMAAQFGRDASVMADIGFDGAALDALVKSAGDAVLASATPPGRSTQGDFLDEFAAAPSIEGPGGNASAEGGDSGAPFKTLLMTMTPEDHDVVIAALKSVQRSLDLPSRDAALVHLARAHMETASE